MNVIVVLCDTLRRDHCGPYNHGRALDECWSAQQPHWVVPTPNLDRLAAMGTVFDNCFTGSTPCMPARRDLYTGRYEFPWRGWAPLEEDDADLPSQLSPDHEKPITAYGPGDHVSYLITDHLCLWKRGAGNYHMNYSGFEFIRGNQEDPWRTDDVKFFCPPTDMQHKMERYFRNKHFFGSREEDYPVARVFGAAADWLETNHTHKDFYLHIDSYDPHEPWDPPEELLKMFDPRGYDVPDWDSHPSYIPWRSCMSEDQMNHYRARYAAKVVLMDRWLGRLLEAMDKYDLWKNTMLVFMTDHGTFNGDHERMGKDQTHEHDAKSHTPLIIHHPSLAHGERRGQLVQNVDIYSTVLEAMGKPIPAGRHGVSLLPVLKDPAARTRDFAIMGKFTGSFSITDGRWTLHQAPLRDRPLYWYSHYLSRFFLRMKLGPYENGRRLVLAAPNEDDYPDYVTTWLSDKESDPNELRNLASERPDKLKEMQRALVGKLAEIGAPAELRERFGLTDF